MAFTLETGDGVASANAYVDVAFVDEYHGDRGRTAWSGGDSVKQAAIIRASEYVDKRFGGRFRGYRQDSGQALEWPRLDAEDDDGYLLQGVPFQLKKAVAEYALRALLSGELAPDPLRVAPDQTLADGETRATSSGTGEVRSTETNVGRGAVITKKTYVTSNEQAGSSNRTAGGSLNSASSIPEYPEADMWIRELLEHPSKKVSRGD